VGEDGVVKGCRPGQVLLLHPENDGYSPILGWVGIEGKTAASVEVIPVMERFRAKDDHSMNEDKQSNIGSWVTLRDHTDHVKSEVQALSESLKIPDNCRAALCDAAIWHDVGKVHQAFQNMLLSGKDDDRSLKSGGPWAKSDGNTGRPLYWVESGDGKKIERKYFRHELASALAWLQTQGRMAEDADLVAYLIAAHHGKIRMSIRSLDKEKRPREPDRLFARGIWDGDVLLKVEGILDQDLPLDLSIMQMGEGSWLERMTGLRDKEAFGPLRLAFMESILRIADWRASAKEEKKMVV
jgi:CRISPR-associated endonuclease/helicase Cas3